MYPENANLPGYNMPGKRGTSPYHTKDVEAERARWRARESTRKRSRSVPVRHRRVIAWDGEGSKLSGFSKPQHYVLFGCSAEPETALVVKTPTDSLDFFDIADYVTYIGEKYPHALHVGYFFKYDHNMIIRSLPWPMKARLYETNRIACRRPGSPVRYRLSWIPGKALTITRLIGDKRKVTVTIDDIGPFFACRFTSAYERAFPIDRGPEWPVVVEGKAMRADTTWEDMPAIERYWRAEIVALERLGTWLRDLMCDAGFNLTRWYGPGALANCLRKTHGLARHEWGGKVENMPPEVHDASKRAYFGGHVEQYLAGRVAGPVWVLDVNSAYPSAFARCPSLAEGGRWEYRAVSSLDEFRSCPPRPFSVWHVRWTARVRDVAPMLPQPIPHRDWQGEITYAPLADSWVWEPEVKAAVVAMTRHKRGMLEVLEGWEWVPADDSRPWSFMEDMYDHRARLKAMGNPLEMCFKLGLNSMYGKMAQRAGWDEEKRTPPRSHTLPLAGYVTSACRAQLAMMTQRLLDVDSFGVVAVETDGIFTTVNPKRIGVENSGTLGAWSVEMYDELLYVQNGVYALRRGADWVKVKTRGMNADTLSAPVLAEYLHTLHPGAVWEPMSTGVGEVFVGLGSAIARSTTPKGISWPKVNALHCRWEPQVKEVVPGRHGKRIHIAEKCPTCQEGKTAGAKPHPLRVRSTAINGRTSAAYRLPWEHGFTRSRHEVLDEQGTWEVHHGDA